MSHSVSPLGSLSSPSPSPPPNPIDESELSELTDDDHDDHDLSDTHHPPPSQRQRQSIPVTRTPSAPSSKRKKRGGLVPAPMWGWAYKNGATGSPSSTPRCLSPSLHPTALSGPSRHPLPGSDTELPLSKPKSHSVTPDVEEEEEEELPTPPRAMEEEEGEDPDPRKDHSLDRKHSQRKSGPRSRTSRKKEPFDRSTKGPRSKRGIRVRPRLSLPQHDRMLKHLWEQSYKICDPNVPTDDEDDVNSNTRLDGRSPSPSHSEQEDEMLVDDDAGTSSRHSPARPTLNTNLKATPPPSTSAMDPATDIPSLPPSMRASVDPTVTPPDDDLPQRPLPDDDVDQDNDPDTPDDDDHQPPPDLDLEPDGDEDEDVQQEEPSQPPSPTPLIEPEPEQEDEDPDLQPAHRAEALDVLATIELKFALLRERVYVEKMEGLAWEETLVCDGTHPELHHLQEELTKRRDKRLLLASKKRMYEIQAITRKRREEETWCREGWDIARTELQTEMIAETNKKRRKLERERRTAERPPGARRIPSAILNPPPAPTLRQIANTFPLPSHLSHFAANKRLSYVKGLGVYPGLDGLGGVMAYPDLSTLSPHEVAADLEFLFQHRRLGYGFGMGFGPPIGVPIGVGVGYNSTTPGFGPATIGFGGPQTPGFGANGLGISAGESHPQNPGSGIASSSNATQIGGLPLVLGGSAPGLGPHVPAPSSVPSQNTPNPVPGPGSGVANADGPPFSQPMMGIFQGPLSIGANPTGYPISSGGSGTSVVIGPGGTTSTPIIGPGSARIQRPSGFVERERELQREREHQRDREIRERELHPRDREMAVQRERERERDFGPNMGPGYPTRNSMPAGGIDWNAGDARRREEKERIEKNERDRERERSQIQPIAPTPIHRHLHQHTHPHSHTHQLQQHPTQSPHQSHSAHAHQSHSHQHHHPHGQHSHQHAQHQHGASHAPPHHHAGQHYHHRHHHHVVHHHHPSVPGSGAGSSGPDRASPLPQGSSSVSGVEIINLSANPSSKSHWKRDEAKLGGSSIPGSRPSSTHSLPPSHSYEERERERDRERDRPIATPFVLAPSHHTISSASSPRHGWTPGSGESGPTTSNVSTSFPPPNEPYHTPVPHRYPNSTPNGLPQLPRPLTTSPPRAPPTTTSSPSISALNAPPSSSSTSAGPFPLPRKPSPALPKLGVPPLGFSPRLAGPGVAPPTGPGVPGVLSTTAGGPGVTSSGILTSGPGVPPGPGIAPASSVVGVPPGEGGGPSMFSTGRTTSPLIPYTGGPPIVSVPTQKVSVDGP